jgi:flagellum-specific peptidoglycan hydrolase FlgJ
MKSYAQLLDELFKKYPSLEDAMNDPEGFLKAGSEALEAVRTPSPPPEEPKSDD